MTDDANIDAAARSGPLLRLLTLVIGSVQVILFVLLAHLRLQSATPESTLLIGAPFLLLTVPGLLLAWLDRAPKAALALVLLAFPLTAGIWI